jgi:dihydropyrimidinase
MAMALVLQSSVTQAQRPAELVIRNGLIVNDTGRMVADIRISGEKIVEIGAGLKAAPGTKEIDARGLLVLPGVIDTHAHLELEPVIDLKLANRIEDLTTGSRAALAGGVTTVTDFITMTKDEDPDAFADRVIKAIEKNAIVDIFVRALVYPENVPKGSPADPFTQKETFDRLAARGIVNTGVGPTFSEDFEKNSLAWVKKVRASGQAGVISGFYQMDYAITAEAKDRLMHENGGAGGTLHNFAQAYPIVGEVLVVQRGVALAEATGAPVMFDHIASGRALKVAEDAQRRGLPVYVETRPLYLHTTSQKFAGADASLWMAGPPIRDKWDQDMGWDGIRRGVIQTIGSDHNAHPKEGKLGPNQTVVRYRAGVPNIQEYAPMLFSEGVVKDRITLEQFVAVTSANAAKIFGIYPRKGVIAVGSDADIVIWDPGKKEILKDEDQFSRTGYTPYAGTEVTGFPKTTIRRGEVAFDNGKIVAQPGSGRFVAGAKFQRPALRPISD